jgi:AcrR family transcriptional regulator
MFAQKGYAETTLADIAQHAGTQAGSLYYYFESREHIVRQVLGRAAEAMRDNVAEVVAAMDAGASFRDRISTGVRVHLQIYHSGNPFIDSYNRIIDEVPVEMRNEHALTRRSYADFWQDLIVGAQQAGELRAGLDPTVARLLLFGSVFWSHAWYDPKGPLSLDAIADQLLLTFFDGASER